MHDINYIMVGECNNGERVGPSSVVGHTLVRAMLYSGETPPKGDTYAFRLGCTSKGQKLLNHDQHAAVLETDEHMTARKAGGNRLRRPSLPVLLIPDDDGGAPAAASVSA